MAVIEISGVKISPMEYKEANLMYAKLYDSTELKVPVHILRGKEGGPTLFLSAAIHGDELNGIEIIRRVLKYPEIKNLSFFGNLLAVPIVNIFGFTMRSRYLPDRRDLNRSFPGSKTGSLASRIAHVFVEEIIKKSNYGVDLHTAAIHRTNLPHVRATLNDAASKQLAYAFGLPIILNSNTRDGSLRESAGNFGVPTLVYEAGEALRFNEHEVRQGVRGVMSLMAEIGMFDKRLTELHLVRMENPMEVNSSYWLRANQGGILRIKSKLGTVISKGEILGHLSDPLGNNRTDIMARSDGIVIGLNNLPLVNQGDAVIHVATTADLTKEDDFVDQNPDLGDPETMLM